MLSRRSASFAVLLASVSLFALPASAAPTAPDIQKQLQAEWNDFSKRIGSGMVSTGDVTVTPAGSGYTATLPAMRLRLQNNNMLRVDKVTVTAKPDASGVLNLAIALPSTIPQITSTGTQTGIVTIGTQSLNAVVKPVDTTWQIQSIDGRMGNIAWKQQNVGNIVTNLPTDAAVNQLTLNGRPGQLNMTASGIRSSDAMGDVQTIDQLSLQQKTTTGSNALRLSDVLILLTDSMPKLDSATSGIGAWLNGAANISVNIKNLKNTDKDGVVLAAVETANVDNAVTQANAGMLAVRSVGELKGIQLNMPAAFAETAPRNIQFTTTLRNLPLQYFGTAITTPEQQAAARLALAGAQTQLQIDNLTVDTKSALKAIGTGLLTASSTPPNFATGSITLNLVNLQETLTKLQQQAKSPSAGANNAPVMMALMMMQGLGQTDGSKPNQTQYVVTFAPDGKVLLNNQDLSGLLNLASGAAGLAKKPAVAAPTAPVVPAPTAPASGMSTWKK